MEPGITWYDVLGVLPDAEARKIKRTYDAKASLLRPEMISGASSDVLKAVTRAQRILDTAWELLGDAERKRYDEAVGLRRSGGGLGQPGTGIESAGLAPADPGIIGDLGGDLVPDLAGAPEAPEEGILRRGDAIMLYTDGMVEAAGQDIDEGIGRLLGEAERMVVSGYNSGAPELVTTMQRTIGSGDDCALVIIWRSGRRS